MSKREFERFYHQHFDKVYRFVFFRVGEKELAEDLVSEIFMKALKAFVNYNAAISTSSWIMTIAKNHLANFWRDQKSVVSLPEEAAEDEEYTLSDAWLNAAKEHFSKTLAGVEVMRLLELLRPAEREIVTLHYLFGYNYQEIAEMRSETASAVKVAAHRALKKLRQLL